jgi:hypothetical protein
MDPNENKLTAKIKTFFARPIAKYSLVGTGGFMMGGMLLSAYIVSEFQRGWRGR